jgi:transcription elongation factor SPT6
MRSYFSSLCVYQIIFKMVEENPRDVGHEMDGLSIVYGDESLPRLYENSRISSDQLPGQPGAYLFTSFPSLP